MKKFTILLVATNHYVKFALELIPTVIEKLFYDSEGQIIVFTDDTNLFRRLGDKRIDVNAIEIPPYGWPEATLLRYKFFEEHWDIIEGEFVMYMDVDCLVANKVPFSILTDLESENNLGLMFVKHPGYYKSKFYKYLLARSTFGTWETNKKSSAYVPLCKRKKYVAGGVWLGRNQLVKELVCKLNENVNKDLSWGYVAKWHDESHLNWWASSHDVVYLSPSWAYAPGYKNLKNVNPIIELVHKDQEYFDQR